MSSFLNRPLLPPPSPSCFSSRQSNGHFTRTSSALFLECFKDFVHRNVKILCLKKKKDDEWHIIKVFGSHDDFFASSNFTFTVTSKKTTTTTTQWNNGASRKEKAKDSHVRKIAERLSRWRRYTRSWLEYDFVHDFWRTLHEGGEVGPRGKSSCYNLIAIRHRNSALSV